MTETDQWKICDVEVIATSRQGGRMEDHALGVRVVATTPTTSTFHRVTGAMTAENITGAIETTTTFLRRDGPGVALFHLCEEREVRRDTEKMILVKESVVTTGNEDHEGEMSTGVLPNGRGSSTMTLSTSRATKAVTTSSDERVMSEEGAVMRDNITLMWTEESVSTDSQKCMMRRTCRWTRMTRSKNVPLSMPEEWSIKCGFRRASRIWPTGWPRLERNYRRGRQTGRTTTFTFWTSQWLLNRTLWLRSVSTQSGKGPYSLAMGLRALQPLLSPSPLKMAELRRMVARPRQSMRRRARFRTTSASSFDAVLRWPFASSQRAQNT
mmetsp:Transcript_2333/g.6988  ORF Transcript_2333/g.6988 Transcript_2333/m.6988 type:complete len:325 (-) Transcript_2333:468-1442(-)